MWHQWQAALTQRLDGWWKRAVEEVVDRGRLDARLPEILGVHIRRGLLKVDGETDVEGDAR